MSKEYLDEGEPGPKFGDFDFSRAGLRITPKQPVSKELELSAEQRVFEVSMEGNFRFHGYSPDEVKELLLIYREHMSDFAREAALIQASQDAARWRPGGEGSDASRWRPGGEGS